MTSVIANFSTASRTSAHDLRERQEAGLDNALFLEEIGERNHRRHDDGEFPRSGRGGGHVRNPATHGRPKTRHRRSVRELTAPSQFGSGADAIWTEDRL